MAIDLNRLKNQLLTSGLQKKDQPLYQVINLLIDALRQIAATSSGGGATTSGTASFITFSDESANFPNSRQLIVGDFVNFDSATPNQLIVNSSEWSVLTDGDLVAPELIFAGGDVVMVHTP